MLITNVTNLINDLHTLDLRFFHLLKSSLKAISAGGELPRKMLGKVLERCISFRIAKENTWQSFVTRAETYASHDNCC